MSNVQNLFMFSGQGSHYYQMGGELYKQEVSFRNAMQELDEVAQSLLGLSIIGLLYHQNKQKGDVFDQTRLTNAAIFMVEYALAKSLIDREVRPSGMLGVSLGIYAAACVAGSLRAKDALALVIRQGEVFERCCPRGSMVAVLASPGIWEQHSLLRENADLASINAPNHCVISTSTDRLPHVLQFLDEQKLDYQTLAVSYAFHSRWIECACDPWLALFDTLTLDPPKIPLICCALEGPLVKLTPESLWNIVRSPIRLSGSIQYLETQGPYRYIDVGPAGTLATLLKYSLTPTSKSAIYSVISPFPGEHRKYSQLLNDAGAIHKQPGSFR